MQAFNTEDMASLLVSDAAVQLRQEALDKMYELITREAAQVAKEKGSRSIERAHVEEAVRRNAAALQGIMMELLQGR